MSRGTIFTFAHCIIAVHSEITISGGTSFAFTNTTDSEGHEIPKEEQVTSYQELDNHQTYELALALLKDIDVRDTRGSN